MALEELQRLFYGRSKDRQNVAGRRLSPEQSPILPVGLLVTAAVFRMSAARQQIQERNMAYYDYDYRSRSDRSRAPRGDRMSNPSSGGVYGRRRSEDRKSTRLNSSH